MDASTLPKIPFFEAFNRQQLDLENIRAEPNVTDDLRGHTPNVE
jgi:hypothetical protein